MYRYEFFRFGPGPFLFDVIISSFAAKLFDVIMIMIVFIF
jgi:hypothetical protein